jgi:hypothetical protein
MVTFLIVSIIFAVFIVIGIKLNTYLYRNGAFGETDQPDLQDTLFGLEAE